MRRGHHLSPLEWTAQAGVATALVWLIGGRLTGAAGVVSVGLVPKLALLGIARTSPLTVNTIRALGPVLVFGLQFADERIAFAPATLAGIVLFCVSILSATAFRARAEAFATVRPAL